MPTNNSLYPEGYFEARRDFTPHFLQAFDQLDKELTLGWGTLLLTFIAFPLGIGVAIYYTYLQQNLYKQLITLSDDPSRTQQVNREICVQALRNKTLTMDDVVSSPISSLDLLLDKNVLSILDKNTQATERKRTKAQAQYDSFATKASEYRERHGQHSPDLESRANAAYEEMNAINSLMEQIRENNYAYKYIKALFPSPSSNNSLGARSSPATESPTNVPENTNPFFAPPPTRVVSMEQKDDCSSFLMNLTMALFYPGLCIAGVVGLGLIFLVAYPAPVLFAATSTSLVAGIGLFASGVFTNAPIEAQQDVEYAPV